MEKITLKQYAEMTGVSYGALRKRLCKEKMHPTELKGVVEAVRYGSYWMLSIDKRILKNNA